MVKRGDMMDIDDMMDILAIDLLGVVPERRKNSNFNKSWRTGCC